METRLNNDIKNNTFKNVYILTGEEKYLTDYYANQIADANTDKDTEQFNYLKISSSVPSEDELDAFASSYPFMSEKKVMLIKDTGIFKSSGEGVREYLSDLVSNPPDYLIIIFSETNIDKRNALYKTVAKLYPPYEFEYKKSSLLAPWLCKVFKKVGKEIKSDDALYMCEIAGPSMLNLKSEADKITAFLKNETKITKDIIDSVVTRTVENRVFDMLDNLINSNTKKAMEQLGDLKALSEEPVKIISIIFKNFASMHSVYIQKNKSVAEIAKSCSMKDWIVKNNLAKANKLGVKKIASVMTMCRDMDFKIKNGMVDKWLAVELIASEIIA